MGFPCGSAGKESTCSGRPGFNPWVGKIPWRRERLPIPVLWFGEFRGLYSSWGRKESDTTEQLSLHFHFHRGLWRFIERREAFRLGKWERVGGDGHRQTQADMTSKSKHEKRGYPGEAGEWFKKNKDRKHDSCSWNGEEPSLVGGYTCWTNRRSQTGTVEWWCLIVKILEFLVQKFIVHFGGKRK